VTDEEFAGRFAISTWEYWLARLTSDPEEASACAGIAPTWDENYNITNNWNLHMDLKSCTYAHWKAGNDCFLKFDLPSYGMELRFAIGHCPNGKFPYMSGTCYGEACDTIGIPCTQKADCADSQTCYTLPFSTNTTSIFNAFRSANLYDFNDVAPGCYKTSDLFVKFMDWFRATAWNLAPAYTFAQPPTLDFKVCAYTTDNGVDPFNCSSVSTIDNTTIMSCTALKDWDGMLKDGSMVSNPERIQGKIPGLSLTVDTVPKISNSPTAVPVFYHSPDNSAELFPGGSYGLFGGFLTNYGTIFDNIRAGNSTSAFMIISYSIAGAAFGDLTAKMPLTNKIADLWYSQNFRMQTCRAANRQSTITQAEFEIRFGWMLPFVLNILTMPDQTFLKPNMSDWFTGLNSGHYLKKLQTPYTCTYESYLSSRSCSFSFTGLQSLIRYQNQASDITLNFLFKDCPGWSLPAIYVECEGRDCALLAKPHPCTVQSDCDTNFPGTRCMSISTTKKYDLFESYFTHQWDPIDSCGSSALFLADLQKLIFKYTQVPAVQNLCFWDIQYMIDTVNVTAWAETQYQVVGDTYSIRDLKPWTPDHTEIPGTVGDSGITLVTSWLLFLVIFISWSL